MKYLVPVYGPLPIWRYGPITNLFGEWVRDGWRANQIYTRSFATREAAEAFIASEQQRPWNKGRCCNSLGSATGPRA